MKEVLIYGITKEPVSGVIGDRAEIQEYSHYRGVGSKEILPVEGGKYFCGNYGGQAEITRHPLPIHTMKLDSIDYHGQRYREERYIAFTPEFIKEVGGNPVEMNLEIQLLQKYSQNLSNELLDVNDTLTLLKLELSTASFWKRLKWVFTGVEV